VADREVTVKYVAQGLPEAGQQADRTAASYDRLAQSAAKARAAVGGPEAKAFEAAERRLERLQSRQVQQQYEDILDPGRAIRGPEQQAAGARTFGDRYFGRLGTSAFRAIGLFGIAGAARGLGRGLEETATTPEGLIDNPLGHVFKRMAEGIPIVGGFVRGLSELGDVMSGLASQRVLGQLKTELLALQGGAQTSLYQLRLQTQGQLIQNQIPVQQAVTTRQGAQLGRFALGLPGVQGFLQPPDVFRPGAIDWQTGELRARAIQSGAGLLAAEVGGVGRNRAVEEAEAEQRAARANLVRRTREVNDALLGFGPINQRRAEQGIANAGPAAGMNPAAFVGQEDRAVAERLAQQQKVEQAMQRQLDAAKQLEAADKNLEARARERGKLEQDIAAARKRFAEDTLNLERRQLDVNRQQAERSRSVEVNIGLARPGDVETARQALRLARQFGPQVLTPDLRAQVEAVGGGREMERLAIERAKGLPGLEGEGGDVEKRLGPAQEAAAAQAQKVREMEAKAREQADRDVEGAVKRTADAIEGAIKSTDAARKVEILNLVTAEVEKRFRANAPKP
jgi:hypothetical protein